MLFFFQKSIRRKSGVDLNEAIRDIIKSKSDEQIMFVKFDDAQIDGLFGIDGYIDANIFTPKNVANFIMERIGLLCIINS